MLLGGTSLEGKTIVITGLREGAEAMAKIVRKLGGQAFISPMLEIRALPFSQHLKEVVGNLARYDWLVFTSANAVKSFQEFLRRVGQTTLPAHLQIAVIGEKTAAQVHAVGWRVDRLAAVASAEGVIAELATAGLAAGKRVLFPRAKVGRELIAPWLQERNVEVLVLPVYETVPCVPENLQKLRAALANQQIDAVTFTSPSAVRQFFSLLPDSPAPRCFAAIGATTARALKQYGVQNVVIAPLASVEELVQALSKNFQCY